VQQGDGMIIVHVLDGPSPRDALRGMSSNSIWLGQTQARLDIQMLGEAWPDKLIEVLTALAHRKTRTEPEVLATRSS
jgi:hypothetical protein